jgi:tRNA A-37 threonylcarbamoyl transferase component Bud32
MSLEQPDQDALREMASRWLPNRQAPRRFRIHRDTTDFFRVEYDDVVVLDGIPYLIGHNAKELRFGLDDEEKFWVKRAVDLEGGGQKILKLVFYEKFVATVGGISFECFRSPRKEARILELVAGHKNFMQGKAVRDANGNLIRILDYIRGKSLHHIIGRLDMDHETYFHEEFPPILDQFMDCIRAVGLLHEDGEKHGDIRRDHILVDAESGYFRWIDFDYNYRHRENIYGYDLFGLGNILVFLAGKGDVMVRELAQQGDPAFDALDSGDVNIVFSNRVVNLQKIYPYLPTALNRVLMHFSKSASWFYERTDQLLEDLSKVSVD